MKFVSRLKFVIVMCSALVGCATLKPSAIDTRGAIATDASHVSVIGQYFDALNRRDLLALTAYLTPDIEWYSMVDGERILEVSGREPLAQMLRGYFATNDQTHWSIEKAQAVANAVAITERSEWRQANQSQSRASIAVYEFADGRIRRITYYLAGKQ